MRAKLLNHGLFPETVPPCFTSSDCTRAFRGLNKCLVDKRFDNKRHTSYVNYSGTKHDGSRRPYATPHPLSYYYICDFIGANWRTFTTAFGRSKISISAPKEAELDEGRAITVSSLSDMTTLVGDRVRHSPYILKADVSQYFPSIYTHVISWAAHGKVNSKKDTSERSRRNRFNRLDWFIRNAQDRHSRGVLIGPDAYRIVAEYVAVGIDRELSQRAKHLIIGAARHVDDFYIGVRSEVDAIVVLSHLRDSLQEFELYLNDLKTTILPGTHPVDDRWATNLKILGNDFALGKTEERIRNFFDEAIENSDRVGSQSPLKLAIRRADKYKLYEDPHYSQIENLLLRIMSHFPHCIDYICLFIAKRIAIGGQINKDDWSDAVALNLSRHIAFGHHHEVCWLFWLAVVCGLNLNNSLLEELAKQRNSHIRSMLVQAFVDEKLPRRPKIRFENKLSSTDQEWLLNLVARSSEFTRAHFGGALNSECEHLAKNRLILLDFDAHMVKVAADDVRAISSNRFGYEDEEEEDDDDDGDDDDAYPWF